MRRWSTPDGMGLAFEGVQTGDGRIFVPGSFYWEGDQWPLRYDQEDDGGHRGAVLVGAIDSMSRGDADGDVTPILGSGTVDDENTELGADVVALLDADAALGVSVDMDDMEVEWVVSADDGAEDVILLAASFPQASVTFGQRSLTAGGDQAPVAVIWAPGIGALQRSVFEDLGAPLTAAAGDGDPPDDDSIVLFTEAMDDVIMRCTRTRIRGATLVDIPAFDKAGIRLDPVDGADGAAAEGDELAALLSSAREDTDRDYAAASAVLTAASAPMRPPAEWLADPVWAPGEVVEVTDPETGRRLRGVPMTYLDTGEVRGHLALWGQCHTGSPAGQCVLTPRSQLGYVPFHHGSLRLADGSTVAVGNLTMGGGHAGDRLSYAGAIEHYDDVGTLVAQGRAGEDEYGVWFHGAGMPDVWADDLQMRRLQAASPSGDWRSVGGSLELTAALAVCVPGFPVPRARVASGGQVVSLVAAGARDAAVLAQAQRGPSGVRLAAVVAQAVEAGIAAYVRQDEARRAAPARRQLEAIARDRAVARLRSGV